MTKSVRVENADTSNWPVRVTVENKVNGEWVEEKQVQLDLPTMMTTEYLTSTRRIVITEQKKDE